MAVLIVLIFWAICAFFMFGNYLEEVSAIESDINKILVYVIFILGGPILVFNSLLVQLLDIFMPEGWDDDNDRL